MTQKENGVRKESMPPPSKPLSSQSAVGSGFDEFEVEEAARFRRDVQGSSSGSMTAAAIGSLGKRLVYEDDNMELEVGPQPMVQPKEFAEEKHVSVLAHLASIVIFVILPWTLFTYTVPWSLLLNKSYNNIFSL